MIPKGVPGSKLLDTLEITTDESIGYLAVEILDQESIHLHISINPGYFTHTNLKIMKELLRNAFPDYLKTVNKSKVLVSCPDNLPRVKKMIELFGFKLTPIWYGSMDFN